MRKFKCTKEVTAGRITEAAPDFVVTEDGEKHDIPERVHAMIHNDVRVNELGYLVIYKDGYVSYSPKDIFEEGYTVVAEKKTAR